MTNTLIMAVPWQPERTKRAVELMKAAGGEQTSIVWDQHHDSVDTWKRVLRVAGDEPVIILEDDVVLVDGWREKIEEVIQEHFSDVIQFFSMRKADLTVGSRYEPGRTFMMNQCYYLPARGADSLLHFAEKWIPEHPGETGYDLCMADWMKSRKQKYWLQVPSLVQHEQWRSEIDPRRSSKRQSITFQKELS